MFFSVGFFSPGNSLQFFPSKSVYRIFFSEITHTPPPPPKSKGQPLKLKRKQYLLLVMLLLINLALYVYVGCKPWRAFSNECGILRHLHFLPPLTSFYLCYCSYRLIRTIIAGSKILLKNIDNTWWTIISALPDQLKFLTSSFRENFFIVLVSLIPCKWVQMTYPWSIEFTMSQWN